jgi:hypothetical protein
VNDLETTIQKIVKCAKEHSGRYYLQRRYRITPKWEPQTENDLLHEACDELVRRGWAIHLVQSGPGISLTGRAYNDD